MHINLNQFYKQFIAWMNDMVEEYGEEFQKLKDILGVKENAWKPLCYDDSVTIENVQVLYQRLKLEDIDMSKGAKDTLNI